jgi:hypothetical protein
MKVKIIHCKVCGAKREVTSNNWQQVTLCKECAYDARRKANSAYVKEWRAKKKVCKTTKKK